MTQQEQIKQIIDDAAAKLAALDVKYLIGVVDTKGPDGGQGYVSSDIDGTNFIHVLDMALPTKQDAINLGIWAGHLINARNKK